jgi:hypothetical protein
MKTTAKYTSYPFYANYSASVGKYVYLGTAYNGWTSGFFPAELWAMYEYNNDRYAHIHLRLSSTIPPILQFIPSHFLYPTPHIHSVPAPLSFPRVSHSFSCKYFPSLLLFVYFMLAKTLTGVQLRKNGLLELPLNKYVPIVARFNKFS